MSDRIVTSAGKMRNWPPILLVLIGVLLAIAIHFPFFSLPPPHGDGGMFSTLVEDLRSNAYSIPKFSTYNRIGLPFTYPPLAFYLAGWTSDALNISSEQALSYLAFIACLLVIPVAYYFLSSFLTAQTGIALSIIPFALTLSDWLWMTGGAPRALGYFFCIFYAAILIKCFLAKQYCYWPYAALTAAGAILSHPEPPLFLVITSLCLVLCGPRPLIFKRFNFIVLAGLGAIFVSAPWFINNYLIHGLSPWINAFNTNEGGNITSVLSDVLNLSFVGPWYTSLLGLFGLAVALRLRITWLTIWFISISFFHTRSAPLYVYIPATMMIGLAYQEVILTTWKSLTQAYSSALLRFLIPALGCLMLCLLVTLTTSQRIYYFQAGNYNYPSGDPSGPSFSLPSGWLEIANYAKLNSPKTARYLILSNFNTLWFTDWASEWFPYYSKRRVDNVAQGLEWTDSTLYKKLKWYYYGYSARPLRGCKAQGWVIGGRAKSRSYIIRKPLMKAYKRVIISLHRCGYSKVFENQAGLVLRAISRD